MVECRLTGVEGRMSVDLSRRRTEVGSWSAGATAKVGEGLGPPSSSPSHVIFQRDLEYSLSWSLTIATINITNCPSLTAPRRAEGFTSPHLLFDTQIAGVVAFLARLPKAPGLRTRDLSRDLRQTTSTLEPGECHIRLAIPAIGHLSRRALHNQHGMALGRHRRLVVAAPARLLVCARVATST